jgi:hypothetical protein
LADAGKYLYAPERTRKTNLHGMQSAANHQRPAEFQSEAERTQSVGKEQGEAMSTKCPFPANSWVFHPQFGLCCVQDGAAPVGFRDWRLTIAAWPDGAIHHVRASECVVALAPAQFRRPRLVAINGERVSP